MPLHRGNGRIVGVGDGAKAWRHPLDAISVRHPNNRRTTRANALNRSDRSSRLSSARPNSRCCAFPRRHPLKVGHQLHASADAQNRNALARTAAWDLWPSYRRRSRDRRKHDALGTIGQDRGERNRARQDLRIDLRFADASRSAACIKPKPRTRIRSCQSSMSARDATR